MTESEFKSLQFGTYVSIDDLDNPDRRPDRKPLVGVVCEDAITQYGYGKPGSNFVPVNILYSDRAELNGVLYKFVTPITEWEFERKKRGWK